MKTTSIQYKYKNIRHFTEDELMKRQAFNQVEIERLEPMMPFGNKEQIREKTSRMQSMVVELKLISNELEVRERWWTIYESRENAKKVISNMESHINEIEHELMIAKLGVQVAENKAAKLKQITIEQAGDIAFLEIRLNRVALHK